MKYQVREGRNRVVILVISSLVLLVFILAIGISMAATAVVARRIGEKNPEAAAKAEKLLKDLLKETKKK